MIKAKTRKRFKASPEKVSWYAMVYRCCCPRSRQFCRYGGRGITVCERWKNSFADFLSDMGPRPSLEHSLERLDNDGNYEPGNVIWAAREQQDNNKSNNVKLTYRGETLSVAQWSRRVGIETETLRQRIYAGWSVAQSLETPVKELDRVKSLCGRRVLDHDKADEIRNLYADGMLLRELAERFGISVAMTSRIVRGQAWVRS